MGFSNLISLKQHLLFNEAYMRLDKRTTLQVIPVGMLCLNHYRRD